MIDMIDILDLTYPELENWLCGQLHEPLFRAKQVWQWLWQKKARNFSVMSNVSKNCRAILDKSARISWPEITDMQISRDGTTKFLLQMADGAFVETVLIPSDSLDGKRRWAQCISSQVGCPMGCTFCATGGMGFHRNLRMSEILGQVLVAQNYLGDNHPDHPIIRNIVFMGMGEPLLNQKELLRSLAVLNDKSGLNFSPRRITVSTCGIENGLKAIGESGLAFLAISLHAPTQEIRSKIMPRASAWALPDLISSLKNYPLKTRERITFEYLLLAGINDGPDDAKKLAALISGIKAKLNIITFNEIAGARYTAPSPERQATFLKILRDKNITAIIRKSKGADISGACGQLSTKFASYIRSC